MIALMIVLILCVLCQTAAAVGVFLLIRGALPEYTRKELFAPRPVKKHTRLDAILEDWRAKRAARELDKYGREDGR